MRKSLLLLFGLAFTNLWAQTSDTVAFSLNNRLNTGMGHFAPFLSTVNQYDRHSLTPNSLSVWTNLYKTTSKTFDYGFGAELNANLSPTEARFFPGELYAEGKVGPFLAVLGMKREVFGNQDAELSSGGLIGSQNSRPVPALTLETKGWVKVPLTKGRVEFLGGMANGKFTDGSYVKNVLMHHKWLQVRVGGDWPVTVNYGLHHAAQWSGNLAQNKPAPPSFNDFVRMFLARSGINTNDPNDFFNASGNHLISQHLGLGIRLSDCSLDVYWQNLSEDPPVHRMNKAYNKRDGLWGLSLRLPKFRLLHAVVAEFLSTTDQSGPWHDLDGVIMGGMDNYYNNGAYPNGWSNYGMTIGNPWLTSPKYNTDGSTGIHNNFVRLFYLSGLGEVSCFKYRFTTAYSSNWGWPADQLLTAKRQFSGQFELFHDFPYLKNSEFSLGLSGDRGAPYGNNLALMLGFRHTGFLLLNKH